MLRNNSSISVGPAPRPAAAGPLKILLDSTPARDCGRRDQPHGWGGSITGPEVAVHDSQHSFTDMRGPPWIANTCTSTT
ncbi:hypothetical protein BVI434_870038 [Burkholderia vietnamiensis]|nr:hypothetical protein BVI434_870038 [Burkholderia vietnamiensis]